MVRNSSSDLVFHVRPEPFSAGEYRENPGTVAAFRPTMPTMLGPTRGPPGALVTAWQTVGRARTSLSWQIAFAEQPDKPMDLLISPHWECSAGKVASALAQRLAELGRKPQRDSDYTACIAYLQGVVAARLYFDDLLRVVIPMTDWWRRRSVLDRLKDYDRNTLIANIKLIVEWARLQDIPLSRVRTGKERSLRFAEFNSVDRYIALAAMIYWASSSDEIAKLGLEGIVDKIDRIEDLVENIGALNEKLKADKPLDKCMVWQVYLNRPAGPADSPRSRPRCRSSCTTRP